MPEPTPSDPIPEGAPDPSTIEEAEEANQPLPRRGPHLHGATDPTDPRADREDATGRS